MTDLRQWIVSIVEIDEQGTKRVVRSIGCRTEREAKRVEKGVMLEINGEWFYTEIVAPPSIKQGSKT